MEFKSKKYLFHTLLQVNIAESRPLTPRTLDSIRHVPLAVSPVPSDALTIVTVKQALLRLLHSPLQCLIYRWNWKSAVLSSVMRASLFFATNLAAGWPAAVAAMKTELVFRGITSGFYGALTENFRDVSPGWTAAIAVMVILPLANHSLELLVHWLRGTHNLASSILASVILTALSTLFNFYVMRRGALIVGVGRNSLASDLLSLPRLMLDFITWLPRYLFRKIADHSGSAPRDED